MATLSNSIIMTKEKLIAFEEEIKDLFLQKKIRAPIHLSRGNEEQLIEIFKQVKPEDWVFSTHRSHYHALLKGISAQWLRDEILAGRSIHIFNKKYNFFTSAIVGGICSIAVGVALGIKRKNEQRHVWCFIGDMAAEMGIFYEAEKYARNFRLPITFVIEDNGFSASTPTDKVWGIDNASTFPMDVMTKTEWENGGVLYYRYERGFPHVGCGEWVHF